jgi:hypothetical protein
MSTLNVTNLAGPSNTGTAATLSSINGGPISGARNRIINGDMRIDQRNAGASVTPTAGQYVVDRFQFDLTQASKFTAQQNAGSVTPPAGFTRYLGVTSSSAYSLGSSDYFRLIHKIEGLNAADLGWGAASPVPVTLSFWVRSSLTGTFGGAVRNAAGNRSYPFSYSISASNTWEQKTITIAGDTTGSWATDNTVGIELNWSFGTGSTFSGTAGAWAGANLISATGATSVVGTNGATFYITGVQLEAGSVATPFERRLNELALCQRYYTNTFTGAQGGLYAASAATFRCKTPVSMRSTPTVSLSTGSTVPMDISGVIGTTINSPVLAGIGNDYVAISGATANSSNIGAPTGLTATNIQASAEL